MGILKNRLRETISDFQEKGNEIALLGEEMLRERDEYLAPLIGRLEVIDDEDNASIQNEGDYAADSFKSIIDALECIDDDDATVIQKAIDVAKQGAGSLDGVNQTIEIEPPHKLIDYDTSLCRELEDAAMSFEETAVETENNSEEFSEEIDRIIQELKEDW